MKPVVGNAGTMSQANASGRLVVVSNRVATPDPRKPPSGGLAVAVQAALAEMGGTWLGWSGKRGTDPSLKGEDFDSISYRTIDLSREDLADYYDGFSNRTIWPAFHYRLDLMAFEPGQREGYLRVNQKFAEAVAAVAGPDDVIWVHDYHLMGLAEDLRAHKLDNPVGLFLHIPFPAPEVAAAIPGHADLFARLFAYDLIGFQTETDRNCFVAYCTGVLGAAARGKGVLSLGPRTLQTGVFPIGIDTDFIADAAAKTARTPLVRRVRDSVVGGDVLIGIDRLDYSKGLPQRFEAFDRFLRRHRADGVRPTLLQISPPTRTGVAEYREIYEEVTALAGRINALHAEPDWVPIRHLYKSLSRRNVAALLRLSRVGLVTPLRDGMNLVAKEYVAAQNPTDPGVLVLSELAGAASELDGALLVNPYDPEGVAAAIQSALTMPMGERLERWEPMMRHLTAETAQRWSERYLAELSAAARAVRAA